MDQQDGSVVQMLAMQAWQREFTPKIYIKVERETQLHKVIL